jgi:hypothetical protein
MDGWADYLHTSLTGEHALFPTLRLTSFGTFITAAVVSASICLAERCVLVLALRAFPSRHDKLKRETIIEL